MRMALTKLMMAVLEPMLRASVSATTKVKPGFLIFCPVEREGTMIKTDEPGKAYRCVACFGVLRETVGELQCSECGRIFPVIAGIPVLCHRPFAVLAAALIEIQMESRHIEQARSGLESPPSPAAGRAGFIQRGRGVLNAQESNLNVVRSYMSPIAEYLRDQHIPSLSSIDWIAAHTRGCDPISMLPYFYQDWANTSEFARVRSLLLDALLQHSPDRESLLVLGAGACGIVRAGSAHFAATYGVDLSLPTLLIARGLLRGASLLLHVPSAQWRAATVVGAPPGPGDTRLITADAATLPFADASVSAVVTQYLMDIVGNPLAVVEEIGRVLKPGGLWINYSAPFNVLGEPPRFGAVTLSELPHLLEPFGLSVTAQDRQHFALLNVTDLDPGAAVCKREVHFFAAHRLPQRAAAAPTSAARYPRHDKDWWNRVPVLAPGREVRFVRDSAVAVVGSPEHVEICIGDGIVRVPPNLAGLVDALWNQIDGKRSAEEIFTALQSDCVQLDAGEFCEVLGYLSRFHGMIDIVTPAS